MAILFMSALYSSLPRLLPLSMAVCWRHLGGGESDRFPAICLFSMLMISVSHLIAEWAIWSYLALALAVLGELLPIG